MDCNTIRVPCHFVFETFYKFSVDELDTTKFQ